MRIIDQCGERLLFLVLWNYGEPLLNCEIAKMISYGSDNGIPTVMSTNGTLLTDDTIRDLITSKLSYLIVSISSSSYGDQIWNIVRERIERFLRLRQMLRAHLPIIDVQLVTDSDDRKTNNAMLQSLSVPGVDRYTLKRASRLRNKEADVTPSSEAKKFCPVPWHTLVVNADGRVVPCCMDFFSTVVYGDVTKNSLVDIWNSKKAQSFREEIVKNINNMQVCQACPHADGHVGTFIRQ
jgi:radical SAM protein with 4Fe4S-binding SPASM domain